MPVAQAHKPVFGELGGVIQIPDIVNSYAYYQTIDSSTQVDTFTFDAEAGQHLHAGINIPAISGLEDFNVNLVLLGPGLPPIHASDLPDGTSLGPDNEFRPACEGTGYGMVVPPAAGDDFFEPFTQTSYWGRQTLETDLPESGTYTLIVNSADLQTGKYVLDTGETEEPRSRRLAEAAGHVVQGARLFRSDSSSAERVHYSPGPGSRRCYPDTQTAPTAPRQPTCRSRVRPRDT